MSFSFRSILAVTAVGFAAATTHAVIIQNGSNTTLFYDNFESVSASTVDYPDASGDFDPIATTGAWTINEPATTTTQVTSFGTPGAAEGNQYLRSARTTTGGFNDFANFGMQTGGTLHAEFMYYVVNSGTFTEKPFGTQISMTTSDGPAFATDYRFLLSNRTSTHTIWNYNGTAEADQDTGVPYLPGTWQLWEIDVNLDTQTFTFSIDGNSSASIPFMRTGNNASYINFNSGNNNTQFLVDAVPVPEPTTLGTIGTAGLLLAARRRRS